jgi:hypothetical protein
MRKYTLIAAAVAVVAAVGAAFAAPQAMKTLEPAATFEQRFDAVQAQVTTVPKDTTRIDTSAPVTSTTVVKGGNLAAQILEWFQVAFGGAIAAAVLVLISKIFSWFGIQTTDLQRTQLQQVVVNGLNAAAAKAEVSLRDNRALDINVKGQIMQDAVQYTQDHASETIKALGLDPKSGDAVEAIRARIETALNDPNTPTPPAITPPSGMPTTQPLAPGNA